MPKQKIVTGVREDENGVNCAYQFDGSTRWYSKEDAIALAEKDRIKDTVLVNEGKTDAYLRSKADAKKKNNHDELAKKAPNCLPQNSDMVCA